MILGPQEQDFVCPHLDVLYFNTSQFEDYHSACVLDSSGMVYSHLHYQNLGGDIKTNVKWKNGLKNSTYDLQPLDCILATWPSYPYKHEKLPKITILGNQIKHAQDNLGHYKLVERRMGSLSNAPPTMVSGRIHSLCHQSWKPKCFFPTRTFFAHYYLHVIQLTSSRILFIELCSCNHKITIETIFICLWND